MVGSWKKLQPYAMPMALAIVGLIAVRKLAQGGKILPDTSKIPTGSGEKSRLSQAEIDSIAKSQLGAMDKIGTDEDLLFSSLQGLNGSDLRRVFNTFGTVKYMLFLGSALFSKPLDLFGWYREELNEKELSRMRAIWDRAGMKL